jgi:hypothetical protein
MQQYDQVDKAVCIPAPSSSVSHAGTITTAKASAANIVKGSSIHSKVPAYGRSNNTDSKETYPTPASLKGQKYPPKPNLQDPFGKQRK